MFWLNLNVWFLLLLATTTMANIYPTKPIANTVYSAGRMQTVTWINDRSSPPLQQLGLMDIELYTGDKHVATLARSVEPTRRSQKIWISPTWGHNGSDYHVRFVTQTPPQVVYSSDFTITMMSDMTPFGGLDAPQSEDGKYRSTSVYALSAPTAPSSRTATTLSVSSTQVLPTESMTSDSNPYANRRVGSSGGSLWRRTPVDLERVKFRLVFVIWPVLIGITMAL